MRELRPVWVELEQGGAAENPFLSWDWQWTWWEVFGAEYRPRHLVVREAGSVVGLVPLCEAIDDPGAIVFAGGDNLTDRLGFLALPGKQAAVARATLEWARTQAGGGANLDLHFLPAASGSLSALVAQAEAHQLEATLEPEEVCPGLELAPDFEGYLANNLNKKDRHELRRKLRRLEQERPGWRMVSASEIGVPAAMDTFLRLLAASGAHKQAFLTEPVTRFFKLIAQRLEQRGWLRLQILQAGEDALAGIFAFRVDQTWYLYNSGYDPAFAALSPGLLCVAEGIRGAIAEGCTRADLLRGDEGYKYHLGAVDEQLMRLRITTGQPS
ncbi:MAG: GNAT family N-acetyltransferase [Candidatus Dormibacteraeota bacterium]|nr:GNAT family N-acetyltransferase [Candidatus Dormibacteraeota bacterium]